MNFFKQHASIQKITVFFILSTSVYAIMLLITIPDLIEYANGYQIPDMLPLGYEAGYISELFNRLGNEGRDAYLYRQIPYDMLYPAFFAVCYSLLLTFLLNQFKSINTKIYGFVYLPVIAAMFDYLENISVIILLNQYPDISDMLVLLASFFTIMKSLFTTIYFIILIVIIFKVISIKLNENATNEAN